MDIFFLTVLGLVVGVLGIYLTWRYRHRKGDQRYEWDDIQRGVKDIIQKIKDSDWKPDILVTVTGSGGIVANLFMKMLDERLPLYGIMLENHKKPWGYTPPMHIKDKAGRWTINVPESLLQEGRQKRILIVDSSLFSGLTIQKVKELLTEHGFNAVKYACLVQIEGPQGAKVEPDYWAYRTSSAVFYYPWGKG
ncbi:MAG: phosphoribosyltransferase family protein [Desulfobaccales bacterium]|nr:phosphoribosyltransferase family protein [Desulfobaccales bacterium]